MSNMPIGIFLGLAGSVAINTGNNLQSLGMYNLEKKAERLGDYNEQNACKSTLWIVGTAVFISGALLNFSSYGFAPQSTLASLESIQFVTNLFLGKWLLHKVITGRMYLGTFLTVGGTILAVTFSSRKGARIEVIADLIILWEDWHWLAYLVLISVIAVLLFLVNKCYQRRRNKNPKKEGIENKMAVIYAIFSALFGTLSVVFAKILADLLDLQTKGSSIFTHWFTYATLVSWVVLMVYWLMRLNNALRLYNPLLIIPLLQVNFIFFAITSGGIYFQEFNYMKARQWVIFTLGVALMFLGIYLLIPPEDFKMKEAVQNRRRSTINERQRKLSEYLMTGPSRTNHMELERRLTDVVLQNNIAEVTSVDQPHSAPVRSRSSGVDVICRDFKEGNRNPEIEVVRLEKLSKEAFIETGKESENPRPIRMVSKKGVTTKDYITAHL